MISCSDSGRQLWEYLDGAVEPDQRQAIEEHLAFCRRCCTLEAEMEAIPLPEASVDHVISNGAINLSPREARVLAECPGAAAGGQVLGIGPDGRGGPAAARDPDPSGRLGRVSVRGPGGA